MDACNKYHFDGLAQDCSNSIANALELLQSCTKPLIYKCILSYSVLTLDLLKWTVNSGADVNAFYMFTFNIYDT